MSDNLKELDERFVGNRNALATHFAVDVALACLTQCLSQEDFIMYAWNEPYIRQCFVEEDLRRIWKKVIEMETL